MTPISARRPLLPLLPAAAFVIFAGVLFALRRGEIEETLANFPAGAAVGAVIAQLAWLACRGEAWRLSLDAVGPTIIERRSAHAANGVAFLVGVLQAAATVPVRALAVRRFAPDEAPPLGQALVADAPVLTLEGSLMGCVLVLAALTSPRVPLWGAVLAAGVGIATLLVLFGLRERFHDRGLSAGLRVLSDRRRRVPLVALVGTMGAFALTRSWLVLFGFGLPHTFAAAAAMLAALGVIGALPIGPTSSPVAALAVFGATDATSAAAAGVAMVVTSLTAILIYAGAALLARGLPLRTPFSLLGGAREVSTEARRTGSA